MKLCLLPVLLLIFTLPILSTASPFPLKTEPERQFFDLGVTLSRGAFAYAPLAKQAGAAEKMPNKIDQVRQLSRLDPLAGQNRADARVQLDRAVLLMRGLHAPDAAVAPVAAAAAQLAGRLPFPSDAQSLAFFNRSAARTVASLSEFQTLSSLPENPAVRRWLHTPALSCAALSSYSAGTLAGLSEIAAAHEMPDLLPPTTQVLTDLRGLRDWLILPSSASAEDPALRRELEVFLKEASVPPGTQPHALSLLQLQALGRISRRVQAQVLGSSRA